MSVNEYLLENRKREAAVRFTALSKLFDPGTLRQFDACGVTAGWRCWEVGAGGPSLVRKMAGLVGRTGRVLATDIDTSRLAEAVEENVETRDHDVAHASPPGNGFDLVHARLVLVHVDDRKRAFENMLASLRPGGWLVIEDADPELQPLSCMDAREPGQKLANKIRHGFRTLLAARGVDLAFGRKLSRLFREFGLECISADAYFPVAMPECIALEVATINMIRDELLINEIATDAEIEQHLDNVRSGRLDLSQPPMISVRGRKP